jgi:hypothetical protein
MGYLAGYVRFASPFNGLEIKLASYSARRLHLLCPPKKGPFMEGKNGSRLCSRN